MHYNRILMLARCIFITDLTVLPSLKRLQGSESGLFGHAMQEYEDMRVAAAICDGIHALYLKNLNKTIAQHLYWEWDAELIKRGMNVLVQAEKWFTASLKNPASVPEVMRENVRNYGGGHYNHSLFWQMMKPNGGGEPKGELAEAINKTFGGFGAFKEKFSDASLKLFGSGWCWLTLDGKELKVETTQNEDTPLSSGREVLLGLDLWEHAYYLQYQNRRADYIAAWWNVVNWDFVAERYAMVNQTGK